MLQACYQGRFSPQVVSAPSAGVPAARLRVAMGSHPEGFPEFFPSTSRVSARRHLVDESPALTAVLQAQPRRIVAARGCSVGKQRPALAGRSRKRLAGAMAAGAGGAPAIVIALVGGRSALSGRGLRAGNGLRPFVRAASERDRGSNDRGGHQKRPHGTTLLPSPEATLA